MLRKLVVLSLYVFAHGEAMAQSFETLEDFSYIQDAANYTRRKPFLRLGTLPWSMEQ